jgi:fatty acid amide hydrolase 2
MATFDGVAEAGASRAAQLRQHRDALRAQIEGKLGPRGVLMCPPYPRPAPRHHRPLLRPLAFAYCGIFNVLELPSTAVPTGLDDTGLPIGVQVVGPRFADPLTLWVAERIEALTGGWSLPRLEA